MNRINIGKVFQDTFDFIGANPRAMLPIMATSAGGTLTTLLVGPGSQPSTLFFPVIFAFMLVSFYVHAAVIKYIDGQLENNASWSEAFQCASAKFPVIIGASLLNFLAIMGGAILFIIPGLIMMVRLNLYTYTIVLGNDGVQTSLKSSWELTKGNFFRLLCVLLPCYIPTMMMASVPRGFVLYLPMEFVATLVTSSIWITAQYYSYRQLTRDA